MSKKETEKKLPENNILAESYLTEEDIGQPLSPGLSRAVTVGVIFFVAFMLVLVVGMLYVMMNGGVVVFLERLGLEVAVDGGGLY